VNRALLVFLLACSGKSDDQPPPPPQPVVSDGGIDGITAIVPFDPASGMHLDDTTDTGKVAPARRVKLPGVAIGISLRSEPSGATVTVDGENLGPTPQYWTGMADGSEHTFAFTMANYALAHYKFVPTASGVLFATLQRVSLGDTPDAGFSPTPRSAPVDAPPPVKPPPTVLDKPAIDAAPPADAAIETAPAD
jgi:hypothetical protein